MKKSALYLFYSIFLINIVQAQKSSDAIDYLKNTTNATLTINSNSGIIDFVKFPAAQPLVLKGGNATQKAMSFLELYVGIYGIADVNDQFIFEKIITDNYGLKHVIFKQEYNGVPVYDGQLRFHFNKNLELTAINGNVIPDIKLEVTPNLTMEDAGAKAFNLINDQQINSSGEPLKIFENRLLVFPKGLAQGTLISNYLVYEVEIRNNVDVREFLYIDAYTGNLVEQFTGIAHALERAVYEGDFNNQVWQEGDAFPGDLDVWQQNEVAASGHIYHLFNNTFGYDSYNGAGISMLTINNSPGIDCPNANWNGVTANYCSGTASDDVIAHEWGHAYTQYTSGLIYAYQAGAINESYSDIWGETVDILNSYRDEDEDLSLREGCNSSDRWRIGEDATAFGSPIRDLWNPPCNNDPGKVTDGQYRCGEQDSGGVHSNSGIPNHAYSLLVDGGTYNGQTMNALGFTKAAHIFWRAQNVYLTPTSGFSDLADALEASAIDLLGMNLEGISTTEFPSGLSGEIIIEADVQQVVNAMLAVEMRVNPDACNYMLLLAASDPLCGAATTGRVFFEDWEAGTGGWTFDELPVNEDTWNPRSWIVVGNLPGEQTGNAIFAADPIIGNCSSDLENGIMRLESPIISLPNIETGHFDMAFEHFVATENNWDGGNLKYKLNDEDWLIIPSTAFTVNPYNDAINPANQGNDNPMEGEEAFTGTDGGSLTGSWGTSVIDLSVLGANANDVIQFRWELGTDGCNGRLGWFLDNIAVYNCTAETLAVSDLSLKNDIDIFPNPSSGQFTIKKANAIDLKSAVIFDINGRTIKQLDLSYSGDEIIVDLNSVSSGMYFMQVRSDSSESTFKLIKQ